MVLGVGLYGSALCIFMLIFGMWNGFGEMGPFIANGYFLGARSPRGLSKDESRRRRGRDADLSEESSRGDADLRKRRPPPQVYLVFGFFQAIGGPVGTSVMGNWMVTPSAR